jgi:hypothetical protein
MAPKEVEFVCSYPENDDLMSDQLDQILPRVGTDFNNGTLQSWNFWSQNFKKANGKTKTSNRKSVQDNRLNAVESIQSRVES